MSALLLAKPQSRRQPPGPPSFLLMEDLSFLLLESGDKIIL